MTPILGIDVGSVAASFVLVDSRGDVIKSDYRYHHGNPASCLGAMIESLASYQSVVPVATASTAGYVRAVRRFDDTVCWITAAQRRHPGVRSILVIGGERFGLISLDKDGSYLRMKANTSCAAGTGSFLDQQARRLNLSGSSELSSLALANGGDVPLIASRCSVFAKTDIIHAQQEGYSPEEICDGICYGLARNASDVLFDDGEVACPAILIGGVARNEAVRRHLSRYMDVNFSTDGYAHLYGALGAAYLCPGEAPAGASAEASAEVPVEAIIELVNEAKDYHFAELVKDGSGYPDFREHTSYLFVPRAEWRPAPATENPVEVDSYVDPSTGVVDVVIGFDIGSTSTKAAVCSPDGEVLGGFYTRTAGKPLIAVQGLLEAVDDWLADSGLRITGAATTGSGRKLAGQVIGADLIIDEISAHARAATDLYPEVDTIIEIGGQDSKFTSLRDGRVVFSKMNTVCAAGTGSFLEEQAGRLGVDITEYADLAVGTKAPLTSDRCTVFMERDINTFLGRNYTTGEILAAAAHSVCENYLLKVASEGHIGTHVVFQGATAKNRALVAAFEQKLGTKIAVSRYCHLTGAAGAAFSLLDEGRDGSGFRGLDLYKEPIPVVRENCDICANHCRLTVARIGGETVAYGFLCGRDYDTDKFVTRNTSGFDLGRELSGAAREAYRTSDHGAESPAIGIPYALHLAEDAGFWRVLFDSLGYRVITDPAYDGSVRSGKLLTGAEFCAPMASFHGHARNIAKKADVLFIPAYLENIHAEVSDESSLRKLCYYTQFAPGLVKSIEERNAVRVIAPVLDPRDGNVARTIHRSLETQLDGTIQIAEVEAALAAAADASEAYSRRLRELFAARDERAVDVVLLGRPYVLEPREMNKGIPDVFGALGIRAYRQEMLPQNLELPEDAIELTEAFHWNYASTILEAAAYCAKTPSLYPVLLTSFKCAPDSFMMEYFTRIMDQRGKPYLILQLDEHESSVGYETRIEAAVRSFANHRAGERNTTTVPESVDTVVPRLQRTLSGKTVLIPAWDPLGSPLIAANLRWAGHDARALEENPELIRESMKYNTGQCIPVHIILHEFAEYVRKHDLDPANTVLWTPESKWSCNIALYPHYLKSMLDSMGGGLDKAGVYAGPILYTDISTPVAMRGYFAFLFAGLIRRMACRIRPYEKESGSTDRTAVRAVKALEEAFQGDRDLSETLESVVESFEAIEFTEERNRPKVAIFGDLYVRDNDVLNQGLIKDIEAAGAEVITTPYSDYVRIVSAAYFRRWFAGREIRRLIKYRSMLAVVDLIERRYRRLFPEFLEEDSAAKTRHLKKTLAQFNIDISQEGESYDNILKIVHLLEKHPDLSLFVQANPAFCCPSLVTEAMAGEIERVTGVPVVTVTYDGTGTPQNDIVIPYIHFAARKNRQVGAPL